MDTLKKIMREVWDALDLISAGNPLLALVAIGAAAGFIGFIAILISTTRALAGA